MGERETYPAIMRGALKEGVRLFRVGDSSGKVPFDLAGMDWTGRAVGVEVKADWRRGVWWDVPMPKEWWKERAHQLGWLQAYADEGAHGLIVVCHFVSGRNFLLRVPPRTERHVAYRPMRELLLGEFEDRFKGWRQLMSQSDVVPSSPLVERVIPPEIAIVSDLDRSSSMVRG